ncbi:SDR family oxidoreductase [Hoyosella altamirensis]|uniref:Uncharacterized protein YbjT (DUF2867 family) n=1 Tax=Hoyosella altamirensis TaxID=616997 RepID=A0A839RIP6_9ACTN|nr:NAD(P)H-binding protein [Hoyosella altamirensis]MBB3036692.1 uncharacterized protein YbjT (DUF2867 family) [Hoyosella altamirensis]
MDVLVTGASGTLGREVVARLLARGHNVRGVSRKRRSSQQKHFEWIQGDLRTGAGLDRAMAGAKTVLHCATGFGRHTEEKLAHTLTEAAQRTAVSHVVYVSIVGVDRIPLPYYKQKLRAEEVFKQSGLPVTIVRATQFHDLLRAVFAASAKSPVMLVPNIRFQPIDAGDVAARLAFVAASSPEEGDIEIGGPRVESATDLAHAYVSAAGRKRRIVPFSLPGAIFRGYSEGYHLSPGNALGEVTFAQYLDRHPDLRRVAYRTTS